MGVGSKFFISDGRGQQAFSFIDSVGVFMCRIQLVVHFLFSSMYSSFCAGKWVCKGLMRSRRV